MKSHVVGLFVCFLFAMFLTFHGRRMEWRTTWNRPSSLSLSFFVRVCVFDYPNRATNEDRVGMRRLFSDGVIRCDARPPERRRIVVVVVVALLVASSVAFPSLKTNAIQGELVGQNKIHHHRNRRGIRSHAMLLLSEPNEEDLGRHGNHLSNIRGLRPQSPDVAGSGQVVVLFFLFFWVINSQ